MSDKNPLTYASLPGMSKTAFLRAFKKPAVWKKAFGVIFITKYKFSNGKLPLVAIPFRKYTEAAKVFKEEVKKDTGTKFILLTSLEYIKQKDGNIMVQVTPRKGGLEPTVLETVGKELFAKLKMDFSVVGVLPQCIMNNSEEKIDAEALTKRKEEIEKINTRVTKLEKQIGKMKAKELVAILKEDLVELEEYEATANKDGVINEEEAQIIALLKKKIADFTKKLQNLLKPEQKEKAIAQSVRMAENVDKLLEKVNKAIGKISS